MRYKVTARDDAKTEGTDVSDEGRQIRDDDV